MFSWYREQLNSGRTMTNQDAYVESIADIYNINIIPYMESWGLKISDETKANVYQKNYPLMSILKDSVDDDTLNTIMANEDLDRKYSLVTNEVLMKYGINSNIYLNIDIDDFNKINGKFILIKDGNSTVKSIKIDNLYMEINNLPIGTYYLQMPIIEGYSQDYTYVQVIENQTLSYTHTYYKQEDVDYNNYLKLQVLGYNYDTIAYQLIFKDKYTKAEISYLNQSGMSGNEYIKIYDEKGSLVTEDISTGGYFDFNKGTHEIDLDIGYVIEINYPNKYQDKIKMFSTLTGNVLPEYSATNTITRYVVINNGLIKEDMDENIANEIAYEQLKPSLIAIIEEYKSKVTSAELNNKFINFKEKAKVVDAYMRLKEKDQAPYTSLITAIQKGGSPIITAKSENLKYEIGTTINLYNLITATDNEDGIITIDKNSTIIDTKFNNNVVGNYKITYKVSDSDNNVSTKVIYIEIFDNSIPEEPEEPVLPEIPDEEETPKPEEPDLPSDDDNNTPEEEPDLPPDDDNNTSEEEPDLPSDDDNNIPKEEPDLPSDDDNNIPEKEPNLPVEDTKPEIPKLPENNTTPNVEIKPTLSNKNNNQSKIENNNKNKSNTETIRETSNQTLDNSLTDTLLEESDKEVNEEEIHDKEMIHDEIDSATGPEKLSSSDININKIVILFVILVSILIFSYLIFKK